jgi:hypothetical protein
MSSQKEMQLALQNLGIDFDTLNWTDLGTCSTIDLLFITDDGDIFFDLYEKNSNQARATDEMCLRCPVTSECFNYGQDNELTGVWGGFYLVRGEVDAARNKHKSEEIVRQLSERIYDEQL